MGLLAFVFWLAAIFFVVLLVAYFRGEVRYRRMIEDLRRERDLADDRRLTVFEREVLYDYEERGDFR